MQTENDWSITKALYDAGHGIVEIAGCDDLPIDFSKSATTPHLSHTFCAQTAWVRTQRQGLARGRIGVCSCRGVTAASSSLALTFALARAAHW